MPNRVESGRAMCPFWQGSGKRYIACEGAIRYARTMQEFAREETRRYWEEGMCQGYRWERCPYAHLLLHIRYGGEK